ncbi:hypothetical protein [Marinobacter orientalis]|uniref:Uncharacterized protein n=1 Tax=Marinobacter orientalis TaxID=1928859 RepID=A0A7Y0RCU8_9GAMM|nr:hypothetical protein [Marinobacter orientalis]NMT63875.1 hypothetical protein [Marinobacter orientalis]TGX49975.1 hypothetical protein DIT72_09740 [Marinobacter orientalis]
MNKPQNESQPNDTKGKNKTEQRGSEGETVLGEINDESERHGSKDEAEPGDAKKHGGKKDEKDAVVGEINDDATKEKK